MGRSVIHRGRTAQPHRDAEVEILPPDVRLLGRHRHETLEQAIRAGVGGMVRHRSRYGHCLSSCKKVKLGRQFDAEQQVTHGEVADILDANLLIAVSSFQGIPLRSPESRPSMVRKYELISTERDIQAARVRMLAYRRNGSDPRPGGEAGPAQSSSLPRSSCPRKSLSEFEETHRNSDYLPATGLWKS